jgi:hypothetical protein
MTTRVAGEGAFDRIRIRYRKSQSFLRRNVYATQHFLTMGSAISTLTGASVGKSSEEPFVDSAEDDDEDIRPAKRRKTSIFDQPKLAARYPSESPRRKPLGHVTNGSRKAQARLAGKLQAVQPSVFYGKSRPGTPFGLISRSESVEPLSDTSTRGIDGILTQDPLDFERALRIELIGIEEKLVDFHDEEDFIKGFEGLRDVKIRCLVQLFFEHQDDNSEIYRKTKYCTLRTTIADNGDIKRELLHLDPFIVPHEELFINRKLSQPLGEVHDCVGLADKYRIMVTLNPFGAQKHWPPFDITGLPGSENVCGLIETRQATRNDFSLMCTMTRLLTPEYQNRAVDLKLAYNSMRLKVPFGLRLQVKWSLPSQLSDLQTKPPIFDSPRADQNSRGIRDAEPSSPLANKRETSSVPGSPANMRSQRHRSNIPMTYNLKALSAQAQGKSPKPPKTLRSNPGDPSGINVTYCLGKADATDYGTRQQTTVSGIHCPFCSNDKESLEQLRLHLWGEHTSFNFTLRGRPMKPKFFVELANRNNRAGLGLEASDQFQLGKPKTLFNLEKFMNGDDSWIRSRQVPNPRDGHHTDRPHESSSSPNDTRHSSPNTSNDTDGMWEHENHSKKLPVRARKLFYVPKTNRPLYHSVTKQILNPGDEIPSSDDEKDEGWLHQKHRDIIMDFSDVDPDEKDYIIKWNPFIMELQLSSEKFLPEAVLRFAQEHKQWFIQKSSRKEEFAKQMETFVMRGAITQGCFSKALDILRRAEKAAAKVEKPDVDMDREEERPVSPAKQRGMLDCECGDHTQPPDRIICRGPVSQLALHIVNSAKSYSELYRTVLSPQMR